MNEAIKPAPVGVGAFLMNEKGEILSVSRKDDAEDLGLPGGKVDPGETEFEAFLRELEEETGLRAVEYYRAFAMMDAGGYWFVTFVVTKWEGTLQTSETGRVKWVRPAAMLGRKCQFRAYNRALFNIMIGEPEPDGSHYW